MAWRTGRKVGRTIYLQKEYEPGDGDHLIGMMDTKELSERVVRLINLQDALPEVIQSLLDVVEREYKPAPPTAPPKRLG